MAIIALTQCSAGWQTLESLLVTLNGRGDYVYGFPGSWDGQQLITGNNTGSFTFWDLACEVIPSIHSHKTNAHTAELVNHTNTLQE